MEIRFVKKQPWCCPSYGDFYIQDREAGRDIHGNQTYLYALFRRQPYQLIKKFRRRKQAYEYLSNITCISRETLNENGYRIHNDARYLRILYNNTIYQIDKYTRELSSRPLADEQLSAWYDKYKVCLDNSKRIVAKELYGESTLTYL